jgi:hypothetical protein
MRHNTSPTPCPKKHTTRPRRHQLRQSPHLEVCLFIYYRVTSNSCDNVSGLPLLYSTTHLHASGGWQIANSQIVAFLSPSKSIYPHSSSSNTSSCNCPTPPLILDLPCQLPFLVYEDGRFHLNHMPHPICPPPRITSGCSHFI